MREEEPIARLEYSRAADRYNEIYKALWQNFSYMALLAGAILTFGKDALGPTSAGLLACVPLLIWFWATFEPLNAYGTSVEEHLVEIEKQLNLHLYTKLWNERTPTRIPRSASIAAAVAICVLTFGLGIANRPELPLILTVASVAVFAWLLFEWVRKRLSVRGTIRLCSLLLHATFAFLLASWVSGTGGTNTPEVATVRVTVGAHVLEIKDTPEHVMAWLQTIARHQKGVPVPASDADATSADKPGASLATPSALPSGGSSAKEGPAR